jgi:hypothetical protein
MSTHPLVCPINKLINISIPDNSKLVNMIQSYSDYVLCNNKYVSIIKSILKRGSKQQLN